MMIRLYEKDLCVGMEVEALFKDPFNNVIAGVFLPLKITDEYPNFYVCTVLPHLNPYEGLGISKPYRLTIDKFNLRTGKVIVKGEYYGY